MNAVVRWLDEGPGSPGTLGAPNIPENWYFAAYDRYGNLLDDWKQQMLHAAGMEYIRTYWKQHSPLHPSAPGPLTVCGTYTTHYSFSATYCTEDGVNLKLGMVQFPGKPARVNRGVTPVVAVTPVIPPGQPVFSPGAGTFITAQRNVFARAALAPIAILSGSGRVGLSFQDSVQGKTILLSWSKLSGSTCILDYGLNPAYPNDVDVSAWSQRDGTQLQCFRNWWNQSGFQPPIALIPDNFGASSTLTDADVSALKSWAFKQAGALPPIIPIEVAPTPTLPPPPPPVTTQPEQPALPPPPAPIAPAKPEEKKDRTGLYVLGAVALVGIGIFALTVAARGAGGGAAMLAASNPRRKASQRSKFAVWSDCDPVVGRYFAGKYTTQSAAVKKAKSEKKAGHRAQVVKWPSGDTVWTEVPAHELRANETPHAGLLSARSARGLRSNRKRQRSRRRRANPPQPESGYAYFYDGSNWKRASDELWETEMMTESEIDDALHVGTRTIDGVRMNVWQLVSGHHYIAQTAR